jgi:signal transduction histidine kinase
VAVVVGFAGLTYGLMYFIEDYFYEKNLETMASHAETFQQIIDDDAGLFLPSQKELSEELSKLEGYSNASVWLISENGDIYFNYHHENLDLLQSEIDLDEVRQVFKGETLIRKANYAALDNKQYITMIKPIKVWDTVNYALYINTEVAGLNESAKDVRFMALIAVIVSILLVSLMTVWVNRNMRTTLKKFNSAIKYVAKGNYEYTLDSDRNDEFGELAREFNCMSTELKNVDGMRREFISNISHDLRSPLTSIKGFTKGMLDGTIPQEDQGKYLKIVLNESERLSKLTEDILDLSKLQSKDALLNCQSFDINQTITEELKIFDQRFKEKNLTVKLNLAEILSLVYGDVSQIKRVISNLVDNGIKFANSDGTLSIETRESTDKIMVLINNTGSFISKDKIATIWMRFSKLDDSRSAVKNSSGLGLAIVKEIIELHGETIDVYSDEVDGVTFAFTLRKFKEL